MLKSRFLRGLICGVSLAVAAGGLLAPELLSGERWKGIKPPPLPEN